jgi:hypothetical protein
VYHGALALFGVAGAGIKKTVLAFCWRFTRVFLALFCVAFWRSAGAGALL